MGLFKSKEERKQQKDEKARKKREAKYAKQKAKLERQKKAEENQNQPSQMDHIFSFLDGILGIFSPSHSRIRHDRLINQGAMFLMFAAILISGLGICKINYDRTEYNKAQAANFMTDDLEFSKSQAMVETNVPFTTQDKKTLYIPLKIKDMKLIDPDAAQYHILVVGKNGDTLKSHITQAQLISYGSTGVMYLVVHSANKFQSQPVQFLIWSGSDIANDKYDDNDSDDSLEQFKKIISRYDTLSFTINLGGQSIKSVPKTRTIKVKDTVVKRDPKTHKKTTTEEYVKRQIPINENKNLYNDNVPLFLYNRAISEPALNAKRKKMTSSYKRMQLAINRINKDKRALTQAGYELPKLPEWTTNRGNDLAKNLPFSYEQLMKFDFMQPEATFTKKQQSLLTGELRVYKQKQAADDSYNNGMFKEKAYAESLSNKVIKNKHVSKTLGNGGSATNNNTNEDNDAAEWAELLEEVEKLADLKHELYYERPLQLWDMYQDFELATSSGNAKDANTGAITYSKLSGHNKHGRFMTIYRGDNK